MDFWSKTLRATQNRIRIEICNITGKRQNYPLIDKISCKLTERINVCE